MLNSAYPYKSKPPCLECNERKVGCHGTCEGYQAYHKALGEEKEQKRRSESGDKESDEVLVTAHIKAYERVRKKRR